jgi:hypothetical protein
MQVNAKVITVEVDISIPKQDGSGSYKGSRLVYTDDSGKVQTQAFHDNVFKFNAALKQQLKELKTGDNVVIDKEKPEGSSFWKVNGILKSNSTGATAPTTASSPAQPSPKSTYETPEERAKKQVYIVRQSSIANAVALLPKSDVAKILETAKTFEDFVFGNGPKVAMTLTDDFQGDESEVF